ncbi:hypothetical protein Vretifemale_8853 [Volvox reticuliferus]|uniref:DUF3593 domain-containing protein n=1 Tax=Volvox reticuliferus TaxID=1737510 RepID=A0A8J4CBD9_9CHLO|nr:hypothetical protein Vretifemale_8853 [Volvox reticuliferus]
MPNLSLGSQSSGCAVRLERGRKLHLKSAGLRCSKMRLGLMPGGPQPPLQGKNGLAHRMPMATQVFPFDQAWAPAVDATSLAPQLFAMSLFPYLCFLFFLTKSGKTPRLTLMGFYFLLVFVGATIPAGIYAKSHYGTSLANVDWLHGAAESLLTITNLLIVLGLRHGVREAEAAKEAASTAGEPQKAQRSAGTDAQPNRPAESITR